MAEFVKLRPNSESQVIALKPGRTLGGRVLEQGTGHPIPGAHVRVWGDEGFTALDTVTDGSGYFEFDSLGDSEYRIFVEGTQPTDQKYRANGKTNLVLKIKLYAGSDLKPVSP